MHVLKRQSLSITVMAISIMAGILLVACGPTAPAGNVDPTGSATALPTSATGQESAAVATSTAPPISSEAYPPPQEVVIQSPYPAGGESAVAPAPEPSPLPDGYPAATSEETFKEPRFHIDQPGLVAGATVVEGQAPPNVTLAILDVSYNGALLGTGKSDNDGRFSIAVSPALIVGNRIGVTVGELKPAQTLNQMAEEYFPYRGDGFVNIPNVGILFDSALVQP